MSTFSPIQHPIQHPIQQSTSNTAPRFGSQMKHSRFRSRSQTTRSRSRSRFLTTRSDSQTTRSHSRSRSRSPTKYSPSSTKYSLPRRSQSRSRTRTQQGQEMTTMNVYRDTFSCPLLKEDYLIQLWYHKDDNDEKCKKGLVSKEAPTEQKYCNFLLSPERRDVDGSFNLTRIGKLHSGYLQYTIANNLYAYECDEDHALLESSWTSLPFHVKLCEYVGAFTKANFEKTLREANKANKANRSSILVSGLLSKWSPLSLRYPNFEKEIECCQSLGCEDPFFPLRKFFRPLQYCNDRPPVVYFSELKYFMIGSRYFQRYQLKDSCPAFPLFVANLARDRKLNTALVLHVLKNNQYSSFKHIPLEENSALQEFSSHWEILRYHYYYQEEEEQQQEQQQEEGEKHQQKEEEEQQQQKEEEEEEDDDEKYQQKDTLSVAFFLISFDGTQESWRKLRSHFTRLRDEDTSSLCFNGRELYPDPLFQELAQTIQFSNIPVHSLPLNEFMKQLSNRNAVLQNKQ